MVAPTAQELWSKELRRILNVRSRELGANVKHGDDAVQAKNLKYQEAGGVLAQVGKEALEASQAAVAALNQARLLERLAAWREQSQAFLAGFPDDKLAPPALEAKRAMAALVVEMGTVRVEGDNGKVALAMKSWDEQAAKLPNLPKGSQVAAPERVAAPAGPALDVAKALSALKHDLTPELLYKEIARNDSWGNFDLAAALNPLAPDFEQQAKVLANILESFMAEQKRLQDWDAYKKQIEGLAAADNPGSGAPKVDRSRLTHSETDPDPTKLLVAEDANPAKVYQTAILGAGASAAYFIANSSLDLANTLLIGEKQPWEGERGAEGQVNHPHPQIDPEDGHKLKPDDGLAQRAEFSKRLKAIIEKVPNQCDGRVTAVEKNKVGDAGPVYWKITTSKGVYFAQKVESALGAGEHTSEVGGKALQGSNMDEYKRSIEDVPEVGSEEGRRKGTFGKDDQFSIAITGGSAAIDVVTDVLRKYSTAKIYWAPGSSGAAFISGTDNDISAIPYFEGLKPALMRIGEELKALEKKDSVDAAAVKAKKEEQTKVADEIARLEPSIAKAKKEVKNWASLAARVTIFPGRATIEENKDDSDKTVKPYVLKGIKCNKAVYAVGQDNVALSRLFTDKTGEASKPLDVKPTVDVDQHFTVAPKETDPRKIRASLDVRDLGQVPWGDKGAKVDLLADPDLSGDALDALLNEQVPLGAESGDGSLKFIGAQGFRELEAQAAAALRLSNADAEAVKNAEKGGDVPTIEEAKRKAALSKAASDTKAKAVKDMQSVPDTLGPNVVNNAQLTSARERIAASENAMPFSSDDILLVAEVDGVSFITANQTVLATHIAMLYPSIPPGLADYLVAQIVVDRAGPNGPVPQRRAEKAPGKPEHHLQAFKAFHDKWRKRLRYFEEKMGTSPQAEELLGRWESETLDTSTVQAAEYLRDRVANLELLKGEIDTLVAGAQVSKATLVELREASAWLAGKAGEVRVQLGKATY